MLRKAVMAYCKKFSETLLPYSSIKINFLPPVKFFMFFCRLFFFFKINLFEKFFQEEHLGAKQIGPRSGLTCCRA